jgi:hypothetical protein
VHQVLRNLRPFVVRQRAEQRYHSQGIHASRDLRGGQRRAARLVLGEHQALLATRSEVDAGAIQGGQRMGAHPRVGGVVHLGVAQPVAQRIAGAAVGDIHQDRIRLPDRGSRARRG